MPNIESIPVPSYQPLDPYHHIYDNLPITGLIERVAVVNNQVDLNTADLASAIGSQGTLANRLAQSLNDDGTIKTVAIDNALHSIAEHLDGDGYVRMLLTERSKLSFIAPNATSLSIDVETISGSLVFDNDVLEIGASDSITWRFSGGKLLAETDFPAAVRHTHYYGAVPVTADYENFTTASVVIPYREGSLRVYVNGVRLNAEHEVFVPQGLPGTLTWTEIMYSEGAATSGVVTGGDFSLSEAISASDSIVVDFDVLYS